MKSDILYILCTEEKKSLKITSYLHRLLLNSSDKLNLSDKLGINMSYYQILAFFIHMTYREVI